MAHKDWCGKSCADCENPCALDENMPCSPDCENLNPDGTRAVLKCNAARCDAVLKDRIEVDTVFGKLYAEVSSDPDYPGIYVGLEREDTDGTTDMTLALAECTPDIPTEGGHALRVMVWKIYHDDYDNAFTFLEEKPDEEEETK